MSQHNYTHRTENITFSFLYRLGLSTKEDLERKIEQTSRNREVRQAGFDLLDVEVGSPDNVQPGFELYNGFQYIHVSFIKKVYR